MKQNKGLTPYPILKEGTGDYKQSKFGMEVSIRPDFKQISLQAAFKLENAKLLQDIQAGRLCYALHIECPMTTYRKEIKTFKERLRIELPASSVRSRLELHAFVIVAVDDYEYFNDDFNDFYGDYHIMLHKGNIVADQGYIYDFQEEYDEDELEKLPSIVKVVAVDNPACTFDVDMENDDILIKIDRKMMDIYQTLGKGPLRQTFQALILMPTIQMVLARLNEASERDFIDFETCHWFKVFSRLLQRNSIDIKKIELGGSSTESVLPLVQKILDDPIKRAFKELERYSRGDDDE